MVLYDVLVNTISNELTDVKTSFQDKISFYKFKKKSKKWLSAFCNSHDGTILSKGSFEKYIIYQQPINKIWNYILKPEKKEKSVDDCINNIVGETKAYLLSENCNVSILDESLLKELYIKIYELLDDYCFNKLSIQQKYMQAKSKNDAAEQKQELKDIKEEMRKFGVSNIALVDMLNNPNQLTEEKILEVYNTISKEIWNGNLEAIYRLLPLLDKKNEDLENGIKIKMEVLSDFRCLDKNVIEAWKQIKNKSISNDIVQILIIIFIEDKDFLLQIKKCSEDLEIQEILDNILNNEWEKIVETEEIEQTGIIIKNIKILNNYGNKQWLIKRLYIYYILQLPYFKSLEMIERIIQNDKNFLDEIVLAESRQVEIIYQMNEDISKQFNDMKDVFIINRFKYLHANKKVQLKFYQLWLRIVLITDIENLEKEIDSCPEWIKDDYAIQSFVIQKKIENNEIGEEELFEFIYKSGEYNLLNNYLSMYKENPQKIKSVLDKNLYVLDKEPSLFLIYVQAVRIISGEKALSLLKNSREKYGNILEYWIEYEKSNLFSEQMINEIYQKWENRELKVMSLSSEVKLIYILINNKKYDEANNVIEKFNKLEFVSAEILRLKAKVLLEKQQYINAFNILKQIFKNYSGDIFVVDALLTVAISNKRDISNDILEAAIDIGTSRLLMLVAIIYERNNDLEKAIYFMTKALLLEERDNPDVYANYFIFQMRVKDDSVREITCVDEDTSFCLINQKNNAKQRYCIYKQDVIKSDPYVWKDSINISLNTAISKGLLRKRSGDIVTIDGETYEISEIVPVKTYLFRICLKESTDNGQIKQISLPIKDNGDLDYDRFKNVINEQIPSSVESSSQMLENYKNLGRIPPTFYMLNKGSHLKYEQFIMAMLENESIYIRELLFSNTGGTKKFILSFSALVMMYKLGVKSSYLIQSDVVIPKSILQEIQDETEEIVRSNNQEVVSMMERVKDELYIQSISDDEKNFLMKEAVEFEKYAGYIDTEENTNDIVLPEQIQLDLLGTFGICDYDAMAIAKSTERIFVAGEMTNIIAFPPNENSEKEIGILDFLVAINVELIDLLEYMNCMARFRFLMTLTQYSLDYILKKYEKVSCIEEQEEIMEKWIEYLSLANEFSEEYKNLFIQRLIEVFKEIYEEYHGSLNPIWLNFGFFIVKYFNKPIQSSEEDKLIETID